MTIRQATIASIYGFPNGDEDIGKNVAHKSIARHPHLIMQTPTTAQIRTAIEVLKKLGEHINHPRRNIP